MTHYAQLNKIAANVSPTNIALVASTFDSALAASAFPDIAERLAAAPAQVQSNWYYDGTTFTAASPLFADAQAIKQAQLDAMLDGNFDFKQFIRAGTVTTITATQVGTFLATIANNYRTKRASIAAASTVAGLAAIDLTTGWPANP